MVASEPGDDRRQLVRIRPQLPNQVEAIFVRHADVANEDVGSPVGKRLDCGAGAVGGGDDSADSFQHHRQYLAGVSLVIHHEHVYAIETDWRRVFIAKGIARFSLALAVRTLFMVTLRSYAHGWDGETNGER